MALTGLNSRGYKNSTLLFTLARIFIAHSPARALINPPWTGIAEPMWEPMQIRHRSAYYDAFFTEALLSYIETGLASAEEAAASQRAIADMVDFCLKTSARKCPRMTARRCNVITALAPLPHPRFSTFFAQIKQDLGFGIYVPDCDTTACSFSAATQAGSNDPILDQPLLDFYRGYQVRQGANEPRVTVPLQRQYRLRRRRRHLDRQSRRRPALRQRPRSDAQSRHSRSQLSQSRALEGPRDAAAAGDGASHHRVPAAAGRKRRVHQSALAYLLPAGTLLGLFRPLLRRVHGVAGAARQAIDPDGTFDFIRAQVLAYVESELIAHEMNAFDAALALMALAHLGADVATFTPALHCIVAQLGEGGRHGPYKAYEWNKMKTPTRILVGGPEVTSAFVLMGLALARGAMVNGAST